MILSRTTTTRCLLALLCACALGGVLHAHPQFALSTVNRYGTLALTGQGGGRLFYTFMIGDVPAHALRRQADHDGDGRLDAKEQQALGQSLLAQMSGLTLQLDGQEVPIAFEAPHVVLPDPRVSPLAFSVEMSAPLPRFAQTGDGKEHLVRYDDRVNLQPVGDVELRIEEGPGVRVLSTWEGAEPAAASPQKTPPKTAAAQLLFVAQGPPRSSLSDRSVSLRFVRQVSAAKPLWKGGGCAGGGRW